jgi:hypothetical protein
MKISGGAAMLTPAVVVAEYLVPADYRWFHCKEETHVPEMPA